jgi:SAM-dependent methyltransferase
MLNMKHDETGIADQCEETERVLDDHDPCQTDSVKSATGWEWYETRYHYNRVENGIIDVLRTRWETIVDKAVLDIGAGSGHWISFYLHCLQARHITAVDTSPFCVKDLHAMFEKYKNVDVCHADFTHPTFEVGADFDVVNVIDVMPQLADDAWESVLANVVRHLDPGGIGIVNGEFGPEAHVVGKKNRYRSLEQWKHGLRRCGGQFLSVVRFDELRGEGKHTAKDNLLVFKRK